MAAQKENLLSPWHVNKTRDTLDRFKLEREEGLRKSENRRMQLQCDILKLQRDKHFRAMRLQWRCQELAEREGRARRHNQQLLQDFQRAQVTLGEMVAHTATMNTIRLEYQRYIEENSPRWHQQLKDHTHAAQKKRMEELPKDFLKRREEEHVTASFTKERFNPPLENTSWPQRATSVPEESCKANGRLNGFFPPTMPSSSWLTQAHTSHDALGQPLPTVFPQPRPSQVYHQTSPQQGTPSWGAPQTHWSTPLASSEVGSPPGLNTPWAPPSMAGPSGWGLVMGRGAEAVGGMAPNAEGWGENRKSGGKCLSQELDIKPVRLSSAHGDSSGGSRDSGSGRSHGERRKRRKEGRQPSSSQESAGTSSADSEVLTTTSATRGKRVTKGQESSASSETVSRCGGMSIQEPRVEKRTQSGLDQSGSQKEKSCRTLRVKSQSAEEESSSHMTEDEDPTDHSEGSGKERGQQKEDSVRVSLKSKINLTAAVERVGEKAAGVEEDLGDTDGDVEHTDGDTSSENEENRLTEEGEDEEESQREENKEEDERGEDDDDESDASGGEEGQEQTGSSESEKESAAMTRARGEQETTECQAEIEDDAKELDEEEDGGGGGVGIDQPQAGEREETDSDDSIILPQEPRSMKVQSISEEEEANSGEEGEGSGGECSVEHSDSDDEDEGDDIERLVAPQVETRKQENELKSLDKTEVIKKDSLCGQSLLESDQPVKMAEDTEDEFDHFYD